MMERAVGSTFLPFWLPPLIHLDLHWLQGLFYLDWGFLFDLSYGFFLRNFFLSLPLLLPAVDMASSPKLPNDGLSSAVLDVEVAGGPVDGDAILADLLNEFFPHLSGRRSTS